MADISDKLNQQLKWCRLLATIHKISIKVKYIIQVISFQLSVGSQGAALGWGRPPPWGQRMSKLQRRDRSGHKMTNQWPFTESHWVMIEEGDERAN